MTTLADLRARIEHGKAQTETERQAILATFDEAVARFAAAMSDVRAAIDGSYRDQIAADDATIGEPGPVEPMTFRQAAE